jgi:hypothetical protein
MSLTVNDSKRGTYTLNEREEAALRALTTGYHWIRHQDGLVLLLLGLAWHTDDGHGGYEISEAGKALLQ